MIAAGSEIDIQFPTFVPVNLTYQTAFVDDDGKLQFRDDIYGRDKALIAHPQERRSQGRRCRRSSITVDISHREVLGDARPAVAVRRS